MVSLLPSRIYDPMLRVRIGYFGAHLFKPMGRHLQIAHSAPEFSDEICEHGPFIAVDTIVGRQSLLKSPRRLSAEVTLSFDVAFIDAAPRRTEQKVSNSARLPTLPRGHFGRKLVFV